MRKYILLAALSVSQCYCMIENDKNITIKPITTTEKLQVGLRLCFQSFDVLYQEADYLNSEQKKVLNEQRENRLQQLLSIPERNDVFVKENKEIIGFLASRLAPDASDLVIFDNAFLGKSGKQSLVYQSLLEYVQKTYPKADKIWFAFLKIKEAADLAQKYGFKESTYMDVFHKTNNDVWQGWERKINL